MIQSGGETITIDDYRPYAIPQSSVVPSESKDDGAGLRFQISNANVSESVWLLIGKDGRDEKNMGPARIVMSKPGGFQYPGGNVLLLEVDPLKQGAIEYSVFTASKKGLVKKGVVKAGESIQTGWMGLTFRVLKFLPNAYEKWTFEPLETKAEGAIEAIRFKFKGKERWTGLNSSVRLFGDNAYFLFIFANRMLEMDFDIKLDAFRVGRYQGTMRAASYESDVSVLEKKSKIYDTTISMNEPLYHNGFTFYQSSFQEDELGRPTMSILSVNRDPGRILKYLGCLLMVFGIIHLFYFKSQKKKVVS